MFFVWYAALVSITTGQCVIIDNSRVPIQLICCYFLPPYHQFIIISYWVICNYFQWESFSRYLADFSRRLKIVMSVWICFFIASCFLSGETLRNIELWFRWYDRITENSWNEGRNNFPLREGERERELLSRKA